MELATERVVVTMTKVELADFARALVQEVLGRLDAAERLHSDEPQIATGTLSVNLPGHEVAVEGITIKLKTREFALLAALAQNLGRVLTREQLLEAAWPDPQAVDDARTVDVYVRRVRVALGTAASLIETVHGVGYKLVKAAVSPAAALKTFAGLGGDPGPATSRYMSVTSGPYHRAPL